MSKNKKERPAILVKETVLLYWQHVRKFKLSFFVMLISIPLAALLLDTIVPYFLSLAIGTFSDGNANKLSEYLWFAGIAAGLGVLFNLIGFQVAVRHEAKVRVSLVLDTLDKLLKKDQSFFANQKIGALTGKFIDFVNGHVGLQDLLILRTISFTINIVVGVVLIYMQTPLLAAIILGLLVGLAIQIRISRKLRDGIRAERKQLLSESNGALADVVSNYLTVKTFARERQEIASVGGVNERYAKAYARDFKWLSIEGSGRILFMQALQIIAILVISSLLIQGSITLSIAIFTVAYLQRLSAQLFTLGELINGYDKIFLQATPMTEIMLEQPHILDADNASEITISQGVIDFNNVTYAYEDDMSTNVIDELDLHIPAGQKVGLVGHSGAGKTTVTRLLLRFDDIQQGEILIDGQDITEVTQRSLRESIAFVPQEPLLFHRTLRENIAYSDEDVSEEAIIEAAKKAHALEFIERLPNGFETIVGERGVKLSGGQRQRIAIARAILKNAPILVLDEATSALDSESEKLIQSALGKLMQNRTSIVIAHRLSTISKLDRIIVLDKGKIVEDGSHAELLAKKGIYARLWNHQSGGFIDE